jgi:hypothetical protein
LAPGSSLAPSLRAPFPLMGLAVSGWQLIDMKTEEQLQFLNQLTL